VKGAMLGVMSRLKSKKKIISTGILKDTNILRVTEKR
jgi:hypothetical protein